MENSNKSVDFCPWFPNARCLNEDFEILSPALSQRSRRTKMEIYYALRTGEHDCPSPAVRRAGCYCCCCGRGSEIPCVPSIDCSWKLLTRRRRRSVGHQLPSVQQRRGHERASATTLPSGLRAPAAALCLLCSRPRQQHCAGQRSTNTRPQDSRAQQ